MTVKDFAELFNVAPRTDECNELECFGVTEDNDGVRFWLQEDGKWYVKGDRDLPLCR
jgi:uncharacterized protein YneR